MNRRASRTITKEAHAAAVRIYSEDLKESERLAIEARCEEDPVFKARYVEAHQLLGALDGWRDELREDSAYRSIEVRPRAHGRRVRGIAASGIAASVLVVTAILLTTSSRLFTEPDSEVPRYTTVVGEQRLVTLGDGSNVTLNTDSQVLVEMTTASRRIVMDRGEAYFEVAPDPLRPFTVEVGGQAMTAYGTAFNLRRLGDGFTLALMDGRLALHRQGGEPPLDPPWLNAEQDPVGVEQTIGEGLGLRAGTVVRFNAHTQTMMVRHEPDLGQRQHWRQGRLSFRDQPMSAVIAELSRYSEKPIRIHDAQIGDTRVFATLQLDSIDGALATLENALPIRVVPKVSEIVILAAQEESAFQEP